MSDEPSPLKVMLTGATGFVGRHVLRELLRAGHEPVCLVRSPERLEEVTSEFPRPPRAVRGDLSDRGALKDACQGAVAVIHLVGIIMEHRLTGQTFDRVHRRGTQNVVDAATECGVKRFIHMSALGAYENARTGYQRTKYQGEEIVRRSGLNWTIFRPSLIHGPDGEFMQLMGRFACGWVPPVMPYFGSGQALVQPVSVKDVAHCFVKALSMPQTIGKNYDLGGPDRYTWKQLYETCKHLFPNAKRWKPIVSMPVPVAAFTAMTVMKTPLVPTALKFNLDQVRMSQSDNICDPEEVRQTFGIRLRRFEEELELYADQVC